MNEEIKKIAEAYYTAAGHLKQSAQRQLWIAKQLMTIADAMSEGKTQVVSVTPEIKLGEQ